MQGDKAVDPELCKALCQAYFVLGKAFAAEKDHEDQDWQAATKVSIISLHSISRHMLKLQNAVSGSKVHHNHMQPMSNCEVLKA